MRISLVAAFLFAVPTAIFADAITVHNTGVGGTDALVSAGSAASFWTLASEPAGASEALGSAAFRYHNPAYFADTGTAAWVSPTASGNAGAAGIYSYNFTFDLTGLNPATAAISGVFGTDNDGSISLNSSAAVATTSFGGFGGQTGFSFTSGFISGLNTIHVQVNNGGDPTAFFVEFESATASASAVTVSSTPEPGTAFLALSAITVMLLVRRRSIRV